MSNVMKSTITPIWDVVGIINGTNADETILIGNHRDAWIIGGAGDPNSGYV
jgi:N-acetylated-alpha-linked acidic dipeptidase